jgi:NAD(P)-dependent dehydrogenase (short-subunit alcohol dehydrogenase family)
MLNDWGKKDIEGAVEKEKILFKNNYEEFIVNFKDKVAVITGGGSGIGRSIALQLAKLGVGIVIADTNDTRLAGVQQEISKLGSRVLTVHCDVSKTGDVENLASQTLTTMGTIDFLINNAGIAVYGKTENMRIADYELVLGVNLMGMIRGTMVFLPHMIKKGSGYIVNTASGVGIDGGFEPYPFSKYAVVGFSERLYVYACPKGVMVSVLCPAVVKTNLFADSPFAGTEKEHSEYKQMSARMMESPNILDPDAVAKLVIDHIEQKKFYILTPGVDRLVEGAMSKGRDIRKLEKYFEDNIKAQGTQSPP